MQKNIEWKWTYGEKYEKSLKKDNITQKEEILNICLRDEETNTLETEIIDLSKTTKGFIHKENKLGGQNEKLSNRHMMVQKGINPFVNTNNYLEHLNNETSFLRPKDSNFSKE